MAEQKRTFLNVVKNEAAREATIYIYGVIGGIDFDTWEEINTAAKFADEFREVEKDADTIHVRIKSPGGYVFEGLAIYNALFASEKKIITYNDGICASMAALILLSGDEIHAFSNSLLMIHNSSSGYFGNKKEVEKQLEASEKIDLALGTAIEDRLGISTEEVSEKYLNYEDNWFTSEEAKEAGFYNTIIKKKKAQLPEDVKNLNRVQMFQQYAAMSFTLPTKNSKPKNKMSKPKSYPNLEAALNLTAPLAATDKGSYLNETELALVEARLTDVETQIKDATAKAEQDLQAEKDAHQAALQVEKDSAVAVVAALRAAATEAGVENLAVDASPEDIQAALTAQIQVLNKKPGDKHTSNPATEGDDAGEYAYLDFNNSIYNDLKK